MASTLLRMAVIALIFLFLGVAGAAAMLAYIPESGSPPSIYDDFAWNSTANGFWHVNAIGATDTVKNSLLTLKGASIELDRRIQTDPAETIVIARVRGHAFQKFGLGIGLYHAGTVGLEFDADGFKCGRGTDHGWRVDIVKPWSSAPIDKWYYLELSVKNPYPNYTPEQLGKLNEDKLKPVTVRCTAWDAAGHLVGTDVASDPKPNAHYVSFDEAFLRTWDAGNDYQVDWFYAGPPSGNPARAFLQPVKGS
jgi:hypothetical protein